MSKSKEGFKFNGYEIKKNYKKAFVYHFDKNDMLTMTSTREPFKGVSKPDRVKVIHEFLKEYGIKPPKGANV